MRRNLCNSEMLVLPSALLCRGQFLPSVGLQVGLKALRESWGVFSEGVRLLKHRVFPMFCVPVGFAPFALSPAGPEGDTHVCQTHSAYP